MGVSDTCSSRSARDPANRNARVAPRRKRDVPAWIDTERVRVHHGGLAILRHAGRMTEIGRIEMLALYRGADSMHDARTDLARMTRQCRGNRLQKAVAAVQRQSPAARRMASISSSDSLSMGEASRCGRGPGVRPWRPHRVESLAPRPPGRGAFLKPPSSRPRTRLAGGSNSQATDWMTMPAAAVVLAASPDRPRQSPAAQAPPRRSPDRED
jgi:hypothetical protein